MLLSVLIVVGILGVVFFLGPRETMDTTIKPVTLPEDLDAYLHNEEKGIELESPDVAKKIVWADPTTKSKTLYSIVYLHGYTATLMETDPVPRLVAEHLKANIFYTRFSGHGQNKESFGKAKASDWLQDTIEAWEIGKAIGKNVIVMGTSNGAALGTWLAMTQPVAELKALVFISPHYMPLDKRSSLLLLPWGVELGELIMGGKYLDWAPKTEKQSRYWQAHPSIKSSAQIMLLINLVDQLDLSSLQVPTLMLYSELDDTVSVPKIKEKFQEVGSKQKQLVEIDNHENISKHVLAGDIVGSHTTQIVTDTIINFLDKNLNPH